METKDLDRKLTPAARQALEELVSEYRTQILVGAKESASELTGEVQEISVHDIIAGINRSRSGRPGTVPSVLDRVLNLYMLLGIVVGVGGLFTFLYFSLAGSLEREQQLPLFLSVVGFGISVLSYFYLRLRKAETLHSLRSLPSTEREGVGYSMAFIQKWQVIELTVRNLVASRFGESSADEPISVLIARLREIGILNRDDEYRLRELLVVRNKVMHEGLEVDKDQFETMLRDANRILAKMDKHS